MTSISVPTVVSQFSPWYPETEDLVVLGTGYDVQHFLFLIAFHNFRKFYNFARTILFKLGKHKTGTGKRSSKISFMKVILRWQFAKSLNGRQAKND